MHCCHLKVRLDAKTGRALLQPFNAIAPKFDLGCRQNRVCGFQTGIKRVNYWLKSSQDTRIIRMWSFLRCLGEEYPLDFKSLAP